MCIVSNVIQEQYDFWHLEPKPFAPVPPLKPSPDEINEFFEKLKEAAKKDEEEGNAECESEDKIGKLLDLAEELGVRDEVKRVLQEALEAK